MTSGAFKPVSRRRAPVAMPPTVLPLAGQEGRAARLHDLVKAPENRPEVQARKERIDPTKPVTTYTTPEVLPDGTTTTALTVILHTKGCHWWWSSGCTFCGYFNDTRDDIEGPQLLTQWEWALDRDDMDSIGMLKVYTSGSLLEDREIAVEAQARILADAHRLGMHLIVESRTEQLTPEKLAWATTHNPSFTVAIGLEAHDDEVLRFHVNKGFSVAQWERAVANLRGAGLGVKTYLILKPPFMSEGDALDHGVRWIEAVAEASDEVSVNPMNIQKGTVIDRLFRAREYRPPWLWTLVEMIERAHAVVRPGGAAEAVTRLIVHPTAGGQRRGAHNCGQCDREVVAAIERYSVSADVGEFAGLDCECKARWREEIALDRALAVPIGVGSDRRAPLVDALMAP